MSADQQQFPGWDAMYQHQAIETMPWFYPELDDDLRQALDQLGLQGGRALDLGTGPGTQALQLAQRGFDVTATDISEAAIRLAETERKGVGTALIPQVAAQAAFDMSGTSFNSREPSWIVGGELRWNLSLGGAELARAKAASQAQIRAAAEADETRAAVRVQVVTAFRRLEAAHARQAVGLTAVNQARERQRIVRDRFDAGMAGVTDVLQASSALTDAEAQRVAAVVDAITSEAQLRHAIGRRQ